MQPERLTELTRSVEDYLKVIYEFESRDLPAQTSAIAERLGVAPPSVSGMIKRLSEGGLVTHVPYKGVALTREGRRLALRMVRRHRVLETYLTVKLGFSWDTVHEEAERLEHAVSDTLIHRMALALGNPEFDPHGAPIPTIEGEVATPPIVPLTEIEAGHESVVMMVGDRDGERLRFIESLGLKPGVEFVVLSHQPFNGPVTVRTLADGRTQVIGHELARTLMCGPGRESLHEA